MEAKLERSPSHSWWWDSHRSPRRSSRWLQTNLEELDRKVKVMLGLLEQKDADSFAQKAEMYYQKRPELVNLVEQLYRAYRSLAEQYDHLRGQISHNLPKDLQIYYNLSSHFDQPPSDFDQPQSPSPLHASHPPSNSNSDVDHRCDEMMGEENRLLRSTVEQIEQVKDPWNEKTTDTKAFLGQTSGSTGEGLDAGKQGYPSTGGEVKAMQEQEEEEEEEEMSMERRLVALERENEQQRVLIAEMAEAKREAIRQLSYAMEMVQEKNTRLEKSLQVARAKIHSRRSAPKLSGIKAKNQNLSNNGSSHGRAPIPSWKNIVTQMWRGQPVDLPL